MKNLLFFLAFYVSSYIPPHVIHTVVAQSTPAAPAFPEPYVDTQLPYNGPAIPIGDFSPLLNTYVHVYEPPAVQPTNPSNVTNNINVIALTYAGVGGINIHFQTPFALTNPPTIKWGSSSIDLNGTASGTTRTYARTPSCSNSLVNKLECSEFFYDVQIYGLQSGTQYFYQIVADTSGTTASSILSFRTSIAAGNPQPYNVSVLCDLGYTFAIPTRDLLVQLLPYTEFVVHGGDISYADNWYMGLQSVLENNQPASTYPRGGDEDDKYETSWDVWQQFVGNITSAKPYFTLPGNHDASCGEGDGSPYPVVEYLNHNISGRNDTTPGDVMNYYSCPVSQRNFTAYTNRFRMPSIESGSNAENMYYSFDSGLVHWVIIDVETDFPNSPSPTLQQQLVANQTSAQKAAVPSNHTSPVSAGPFGIAGNYYNASSWGQIQWLIKDLSSVDKTNTPWIVVMGHRPQYSSSAGPAPGGNTGSYFQVIRQTFEPILLKYGVDLYIAGHIHWYERLWPMSANGVVDQSAIRNNNTYISNGKSITHIVSGQAGNQEDHSTGTINSTYTAVLDQTHFGFGVLSVINATALKYTQLYANDGSVGDTLYIVKPNN